MLYYNVTLRYNDTTGHNFMKSESKKLGKNLKKIRTEKGFSQADIAKVLKMSRGFISNVENGKTNPTLATIAKLAKAVDVSTDELMK